MGDREYDDMNAFERFGLIPKADEPNRLPIV